MAFESTWLNEPYILLTEYTGHVTGNDVNLSMLQYLGAAQAQPIYILLDFSQSDYVPHQVLELSSVSQVINHANTRWFVVINPAGRDSYATRLLAGTRIKSFPDRPSAIAFIRGMVRLDTGEVLTD